MSAELEFWMLDKLGGTLVPIPEEVPIPGSIGEMVDQTRSSGVFIRFDPVVPVAEIFEVLQDFFNQPLHGQDIWVTDHDGRDVVIGSVEIPEDGGLYLIAGYSLDDPGLFKVSIAPPIS